MEEDNYDIMLAFVLIGNICVGKSQIFSRLKGNKYLKNIKEKVGINLTTKRLKIEGHEV